MNFKSTVQLCSVTVALLVAHGAYAADAVFGVQLGAPLPSSVSECHFRSVGPAKLYDTMPAATCFEAAVQLTGYGRAVRRLVFAPAESPPIVKNWNLILLEANGLVIGVEFFTAGVDSQSTVFDALQAKYGKPSSQSSRPVQNLLGARFDAISACWRTPSLVVTFEGVGSRLTSGEVFVDLPEADVLRRSWGVAPAAQQRKL